MDAVKISVIIPVYNRISFLDKCIGSITEQGFSDFEIILIDDGSTDGSYEKCLEYAAKDERIKAFQQEHLKLSVARNNGMSRASGQYVMFLDSDDYIADGSLQLLWKAVSDDDLDIARANRYIVKDGVASVDSRRSGISTSVMQGSDYFRHVVEIGAYSAAVWLGLYRRQFIIDNGLTFLPGLLHEDELWTPCALLAAKRVRYVDSCIYYYIVHQDSIMLSTKNKQRALDLIAIAKALGDVPNVPDSCKRVWYDNLLGKYFLGFCMGEMHIKENREQVSKLYPLKYVRSLKNAARYAVYLVNYRLFYALNTAAIKRNKTEGITRT